MFSFGLSSVTTEISVTDFEHVFFCSEKYGITIVVVLNQNTLPNKQNLLKVATETLKQDVKPVKS